MSVKPAPIKFQKTFNINNYFKDGSARFILSDISETLNEARIRFNINDPVKLSQLGIAYNTSLTINSFLNGEERVKFLCQYYNKMNNISMLTTIYSESIATGEVRGFIEETNLDQINSNEKEEDEENSFLKISKILYHHTSEVYGVVKLRNSTKLTEDDIYSYFEESEQIRTHINFTSFPIAKILFSISKMPSFTSLIPAPHHALPTNIRWAPRRQTARETRKKVT
jgi:redox-regulated HSP33 family molecular chaperone